MVRGVETVWTETDRALQAYLLGTVDFDAVVRLQRRLHYETTGDRNQASLILCEHPPLITVGRLGSRAHIRVEPQQLALRGWPIRWVNRGGGCILHTPGQLSLYAILPLDRLGLNIPGYLHKLGEVCTSVLDDFSIRGRIERSPFGVRIAGRMVAALGIAVRDWVSYFGLTFNLDPDLDAFRHVHCDPEATEPMTSLVRERRGLVRPALVRERLLEHFAASFGFGRTSLFSDHAALRGEMSRRGERRGLPIQ